MKENDFEKIVKNVMQVSQKEECNPYVVAKKEIDEFIKDDEDKLFQLDAECKSSNMELVASSYFPMITPAFTILEIIISVIMVLVNINPNSEFSIFRVLIINCVAQVILIPVVYVCIVRGIYKKAMRKNIGRYYVAEAIEEKKKKLCQKPSYKSKSKPKNCNREHKINKK